MSDDEKLLNLLEAHGQEFLQSFNLSGVDNSTKRKARVVTSEYITPKRARRAHEESSSEEEWGGIQPEGSTKISDSDSELDFEHDDGFTAGGLNPTDERTIVFSESKFLPETISKTEMKAFMSSKVSKFRGADAISSQKSIKNMVQEEDDERTNAENDVLLHRLVHTQLLSGSTNPGLDMKPAQQRKALSGRVIELAEGAKLGKGEKVIRDSERNKAGKRVREGLVRKQQERQKQKLDEAKNMGNYHPTLKKLFETSSTPVSRSKNRGLKMGVGKFHGGVLQLSKQEIASVTGGPQRSNGKKGRKRT